MRGNTALAIWTGLLIAGTGTNALADLVASDDFDGGATGFGSWVFDSNASSSSAENHTSGGANSAELLKKGTATNSFHATGYSPVTISFWHMTVGPASNEKLKLSVNGTQVWQSSGGVYAWTQEVDLDITALLDGDEVIQFKGGGNNTNDKFYVDDIFVDGALSGSSNYLIETIVSDGGVYSVPRDCNGAGGWQTTDDVHIWYMGDTSDPYAVSYDKVGETWSGPYKLGNSPHSNGDHHFYPTGLRLPDGRLMVFYGSHNSIQRYSISTNADDISSWSMDSEISSLPSSTYPFPFLSVADDEIFVMTRETKAPTDWRPLVMVSSKDNGATWSPCAVDAINTNNLRTDNLNEIYVQSFWYEYGDEAGNAVDKAHIMWTLAGGGTGNHQHDLYHKDVYYAYFETATRTFFAVDGTDLGTEIGNSELTSCLVKDSGDYTVWKPHYQGALGLTNSGKPVVAVHIQNLVDSNLTYLAVWAWNGTSWVESTLGTSVSQARYIYREEGTQDTLRMFTSPDLDVWKSTDAGLNWVLEETLNLPAGYDDLAIVQFLGGETYTQSPFMAAAMEYALYNGDNKELVIPHRDIATVGYVGGTEPTPFSVPATITGLPYPSCPTPPPNLIQNGDFALNDAYWDLYVDTGAGAAANFSVISEEGFVDITSGGSNDYDIQLRQYGITLENGTTYRVEFDVRTDSGTRQFRVSTMQHLSPYTNFWISPYVNADTTLTHKVLDWTMTNPSETNSRLRLRVGASQTNLFFDNVEMYVLGAPECGNGIRETGEDCDLTDLGGATCASQGFYCGTLTCDGVCSFDTGSCVAGSCGDSTIQSACGEVCEEDADCPPGESCAVDCMSCGVCIAAGQGQPCTASTVCCSGAGNCTGGKPADRVCN